MAAESSLKDAIAAQNAAFGRYFAANDMESLKNMYTEDCKVMPQGSETQYGNSAIPKVMGEIKEAGASGAVLTEDEVGPLGGSGDFVYERGHYVFTKADGSEMAVGKHVVIWKKTPEGYKLYIDIFNDNK